jgi:hypothetical protein
MCFLKAGQKTPGLERKDFLSLKSLSSIKIASNQIKSNHSYSDQGRYLEVTVIGK